MTKPLNLTIGFIFIASLLFSGQPATASNAQREHINLDQGWRFAYGDAKDPSHDFGYGTRPFFFAKAGYGDGPAAVDFNDEGWRRLDLPHDWAVELPFDSRGNTNHGSKAIGANFPGNSVGWYRKTIDIPAKDADRRIALTFDGVYRDSVLWVNGHYIGTEPSGYTSFSYDITDYINFGGPNVIAMRVDASVEEGWFYEGAGIYRHVWLDETAPLHVATWGTFVSSTLTQNHAQVTAAIKVANDSHETRHFSIEARIIAPDGTIVADHTDQAQSVDAESTGTITQHLQVAEPQLWSIVNPQLYRLVTLIRDGHTLVDRNETPFGIRTVLFDPDKGFFLNGEHVELKGINYHQDAAGVGVAVPDALITYRLKQLKSIGVNALRMAHNPPTPELLDAADRMGFLVIDENRMMGTSPEIRSELEALVTRDRNHPSVIIWSVGNEEWALEWSPLGTRLGSEMQWIVHRLDPTRRTTVATSGSGQGVSLSADVIGFNYHTQHHIDAFHAAHPLTPSIMTEEGSTYATRGVYTDDYKHVHIAAYDKEARPGNSSSIQEAWQFTAQRPFLSGMFVWTGFDYRGEPTPFGWPAISSQFGMFDTTGLPKDSAYYLKSVWTTTPMVHLLPHWNWAGKTGQPIDVWVYANTDSVELFLNGKSLGRKKVEQYSHAEWSVPYAPGVLKAVGYTDGKLAVTTQEETTGAASAVCLSPDRTTLNADGKDVAVITVAITDSQGQVVPDASNLVGFEVSGPVRMIGVGNGDPASHEADKPADRYSFLSLGDWRSKAVDTIDNRSEISIDTDTNNWRDPFQWLPPEKQPPLTSALILRGQFARPDLTHGEILQLLVARLAPDQLVYLNGQPAELKPEGDGYLIDIDPAKLSAQNNLTFVITTPAAGVSALADKSQGGVNWAQLRITKPAAPWQRHAFNGYAQIFVQSTGMAGQAVVTARSSGFNDARAILDIR